MSDYNCVSVHLYEYLSMFKVFMIDYNYTYNYMKFFICLYIQLYVYLYLLICVIYYI